MKCWQSDPGGIADRLKINLVLHQGQQVADHNTQQNGQPPQKSPEHHGCDNHSRPNNTRNITAAIITTAVVPKVVSGTSTMPSVVAPARFSPISARIVPITAGGITA